jgi:hypothetical protein
MQMETELAGTGNSGIATRIAAFGGAAGLAGAAGVVASIDPTTSRIFPICPLYAITGFACPGCGLTRGFHAMFHGDVSTALDFNLLVPIWAGIFGYVLISLFVLSVRGRMLPMWPTNQRFMWVFFVVLVTFGVVRNLPVYPLTILFP